MDWWLEMQLLVYREKSRGEQPALRGASADGQGVRDMFTQLHMLVPDNKENHDDDDTKC